MIKKSSIGKIGGFDFSKKTQPKYKKIEPYEEDTKTGEVLNKSLNNIFVYDGEQDIYQIIQSHKKECDIYEILRNCKASGTLDALGNPKKATYGDITELPKDIATTMESLTDNQKKIEELTEEYKKLKAAMEEAKAEASKTSEIKETAE